MPQEEGGQAAATGGRGQAAQNAPTPPRCLHASARRQGCSAARLPAPAEPLGTPLHACRAAPPAKQRNGTAQKVSQTQAHAPSLASPSPLLLLFLDLVFASAAKMLPPLAMALRSDAGAACGTAAGRGRWARPASSGSGGGEGSCSRYACLPRIATWGRGITASPCSAVQLSGGHGEPRSKGAGQLGRAP